MHINENIDYDLFIINHVNKAASFQLFPHDLRLSVLLFWSQGYMKPLKHPENSPLCDPSLVDEMFYQIPEILEHHEQFLEQVLDCVSQWHDRQTIGHVLVQSVRSWPLFERCLVIASQSQLSQFVNCFRWFLVLWICTWFLRAIFKMM